MSLETLVALTLIAAFDITYADIRRTKLKVFRQGAAKAAAEITGGSVLEIDLWLIFKDLEPSRFGTLQEAYNWGYDSTKNILETLIGKANETTVASNN